MGKNAMLGFAFLISIPVFVSCQGNPEPKAVLQKGIAAHGGLDAITKPRRGIVKGSRPKIGGFEMCFEETFDLPKSWKRVTTINKKGKKETLFQLKRDGKLWQWSEGEVATPKPDDGRTKPHFELIAILRELLDDRIKLTARKGVAVDDRPTVGFRAKWKDGEGEYYFDRESGLLVQTNMKITPEPGVNLDIKVVFRNYKKIDGLQIPYRLRSYIKGGPKGADSVLASDLIISEVKLLKSLPPDAFALPKGE
ncbi:MAG: hypothetical protein HYX68_20995 [Planctomycetes bacterium]|nr:hypothetical protein [Planctomycetota bacterium]